VKIVEGFALAVEKVLFYLQGQNGPAPVVFDGLLQIKMASSTVVALSKTSIMMPPWYTEEIPVQSNRLLDRRINIQCSRLLHLTFGIEKEKFSEVKDIPF
jgi:hypothetical protein